MMEQYDIASDSPLTSLPSTQSRLSSGPPDGTQLSNEVNEAISDEIPEWRTRRARLSPVNLVDARDTSLFNLRRTTDLDRHRLKPYENRNRDLADDSPTRPSTTPRRSLNQYTPSPGPPIVGQYSSSPGSPVVGATNAHRVTETAPTRAQSSAQSLSGETSPHQISLGVRSVSSKEDAVMTHDNPHLAISPMQKAQVAVPTTMIDAVRLTSLPLSASNSIHSAPAKLGIRPLPPTPSYRYPPTAHTPVFHSQASSDGHSVGSVLRSLPGFHIDPAQLLADIELLRHDFDDLTARTNGCRSSIERFEDTLKAGISAIASDVAEGQGAINSRIDRIDVHLAHLSGSDKDLVEQMNHVH
jgi:hypothetical protein